MIHGFVVVTGAGAGRQICFAHHYFQIVIVSLTDVPNISQKGTRLGNWLTREQAKDLLAVPDRSTLKGKRDYVILALLVGCALRRNELAELDVATIQQREGRWVLADLEGQGPAHPHRRPPDLGEAGVSMFGRLWPGSTKAGCCARSRRAGK